MKRIGYLTILIWILLPLQVLATDNGREYLSALPEVPQDHARIGEGVTYCYAGYGTQQFSFKPGDSAVHADDVSNPYLPRFDPMSTTFLRFGCKNDLGFIDISTVDESLRFNDEVLVDGITYNTIRFQYRVVTAGHSFSLLPHRFYLDLGLGYAILDYRLGRYGGSYSSQIQTDITGDAGVMIRAGLSVIINHYVLLNWQHEKSVASNSVTDYTGQFGINFISRF